MVVASSPGSKRWGGVGRHNRYSPSRTSRSEGVVVGVFKSRGRLPDGFMRWEADRSLHDEKGGLASGAVPQAVCSAGMVHGVECIVVG